MPVSPYKRSSRVAGEIYQVLIEACRNQLSDPRLQGVEMTVVEMTDDLQLVKLYYYIEGDAEKRKKALKGLHSAKGFFKKVISQNLNLRLVPDIKFFFDETFENADKIEKLLSSIKQGGV